MAFEISLPEKRRRQMEESGLWEGVPLCDLFNNAVESDPDAVAVTDRNSADGITTQLTYRELSARVDRIALGLAAMGVEAGDVVSFQLPNWWQFVAMVAACARIGAVCNPLMPIFRHRELRLMLPFAESKVVIGPRVFRGYDHAAMLREVVAGLPRRPRLFILGGEGEESFEAGILDRAWEAETDAAALFAARRPDANALAQLMFTSGTSGEPKAVMHTSNTILAAAREYARWVGLTGEDRVFMASPLAHQTGFILGLVMSWFLKTRISLLDVWSPQEAGRVIEAEQSTFTMASTPFLADLSNAELADAEMIRSLRVFVCAGAPIPPEIVRRAMERLRFSVLSAWGMTENGAVTITRPGDPPEKIFGTDGKAIRGMEVKVAGPDGRTLPPGQVGDLLVRGGANFVGYLKRPELNDTDEEDWFRTGDLARMDEDGYIRITGRSKDVIIRGGENIPVMEIESVLYRHPAVLEVAIVAMPDPRLVERACAFVVPRPAMPFSLDELRQFLQSEGVAKNYWPERVEIVEEMPRTPSGKIQKFRLREIAADFVQDSR